MLSFTLSSIADRWLESGGNMYNSDYDVDNHYWYNRKHFYLKNIRNEMDETKSREMKLKIENIWLGWDQSHRQSLRKFWYLNHKCYLRREGHTLTIIWFDFLVFIGKLKFCFYECYVSIQLQCFIHNEKVRPLSLYLLIWRKRFGR